MDESCSVKEFFKNEITSPRIIRISKVFTHNNQNPENIMILSKGNNKIQYNLTNKINHRYILNSLKTIQSSPKNENFNSNLYYSSLKYPNTENINTNVNNFHKPFIKEKIKQESNTLLKNININNNNFLKSNINDIKMIRSDQLIQPKKEKKTNVENKRIFLPGMKVADNKESERKLLKRPSLNNDNEIKNENLNDQYNNAYPRNIMNNAIAHEQKINMQHFLSRKQMTYENSQKIESKNNIDNIDNNIDRTSGLIYIKNKNNLLDKENLNELIDKYSKNYLDDKQCFICERTYIHSKKIFSAKCNIHFFCKECLNVYFKNLIDKGIKKMKCPMYKCKYDFDKNILEQILDIKYFSILYNQNNNIEEKNSIISEKIFENKFNSILTYQNKNVFQINSKLNLYKIKKLGNEYCPKCHEPSLFCLTFSFFNKCLNCGYKSCKYCEKTFTNYHLIINDPRHCKVYYRKTKLFNKTNMCFNFIIELLYVIGIYLIMHIYILTKNNLFLFLFGIDKNKYNKNVYMLFLINFFLYFFNCLIYLIILPFLIIFIPFFPIFILLVDGF